MGGGEGYRKKCKRDHDCRGGEEIHWLLLKWCPRDDSANLKRNEAVQESFGTQNDPDFTERSENRIKDRDTWRDAGSISNNATTLPPESRCEARATFRCKRIHSRSLRAS